MILVTGATGLVGGNLLWQLLQENDRVKAIRRTTSNLTPLRSIFSYYTSDLDTFLAKIDWIIADVLEPESLRKAFRGVDVVYHCAALVSLSGKADLLTDTNIIGTKNVIDAALNARIQKLCFVSSIAACGSETGNKLINEESVWMDISGRSLYSRSKYYSEQEVWRGIEKGLNAVIVNPGVILGVSGTNTGSSQLFSQVRKGLMFYTNGGSGYVDVQDVVRAMIQLVKSDISGGRFILVSENCSSKDILCWMADGFGKWKPFVALGKNALYIIGYVSEIIGKIFGFKPSIDRGIARTATNREYYSAFKIQQAIGFEFKPIEKCVREVCGFIK